MCWADAACKGFAFHTGKRHCYLYHRVYMGGQDTKLARQMGLYSSGLAIVRKRGFISAFKGSAFPAPPVLRRIDEHADGGVKAGHVIGATDEIGEKAIEVAHPIKDIHCTILNLLGLDDAKLTYFHGGRFKQLSQVGGQVISELIA